jgi:hypothetical protein
MLHPDLLYDMVRQDHQARIDAAEESRQARLASTAPHRPPAAALVAAEHRPRRQWPDRHQRRGDATECA